MKRNFKSSVRLIWLIIGVFSLILLFTPRVEGWQDFTKNTILALNAVMFILSLPCSVFAVPVVVAAAYYLDMHPTSSRGMTLSTILLFVIGLMQWFWIARFWSPSEPPLQMLGLLGEKSDMTAAK
jgi:energy-converting hydrogenase Eha subunit C